MEVYLDIKYDEMDPNSGGRKRDEIIRVLDKTLSSLGREVSWRASGDGWIANV
jgi:hypothetical protein